ncbi:uncharacterized protein MYCFIDRAFT_171876 [Pseudocercospora fijiensis CIRAD86]|uniref:Uncharacterized protein n=1 Tax=Pseudocercospora fijiensis (strain CIRAD86) TaxID=383855 RepID=M3A4M5_PSEFD|nr:uncharacterized protein MYCFIDRAFT_171876 [Pseudocercospora fijiensis CIRAD86]EME86069.1 hypothetical protein MYCFIDRAFT_171876 [Pseudocercospora fijiensis CIRAD86]
MRRLITTLPLSPRTTGARATALEILKSIEQLHYSACNLRHDRRVVGVHHHLAVHMLKFRGHVRLRQDGVRAVDAER